MKIKLLFITIFFLSSFNAYAKTVEDLKQQIDSVLEGKSATVGVAILSDQMNAPLSINGNKSLPMQSVYKFHLGLAILDKVDQGSLSLSDEIEITKKDVDNKLWSPIRKKYPEGTTLSLAEVLKYTLASSDNVGCDILFKIVGGPKVVEEYIHQQGVSDIAIKYDEVTKQAVWEHQYENWTTAEAAVAALKLFYENDGLLSENSHRFLWDTMKSSKTGSKTIRGQLPEGTLVANKTGSSRKNDAGLTAAQNDIGLVFLPNGQYFYISVLVSDSLETSDVNQKIISDIAKVTWDYFTEAVE